jgi:hypothetical protein
MAISAVKSVLNKGSYQDIQSKLVIDDQAKASNIIGAFEILYEQVNQDYKSSNFTDKLSKNNLNQLLNTMAKVGVVLQSINDSYTQSAENNALPLTTTINFDKMKNYRVQDSSKIAPNFKTTKVNNRNIAQRLVQNIKSSINGDTTENISLEAALSKPKPLYLKTSDFTKGKVFYFNPDCASCNKRYQLSFILADSR